MLEPFLGEIMLFAGNFAPKGWMACAGQSLPIAQYSALYAILGTMYGGDGGTVSFRLPDLRNAVPVGAGHDRAGNYRILGEYRVNSLSSHGTAAIATLGLNYCIAVEGVFPPRD